MTTKLHLRKGWEVKGNCPAYSLLPTWCGRVVKGFTATKHPEIVTCKACRHTWGWRFS